jgi:hypothetical protein
MVDGRLPIEEALRAITPLSIVNRRSPIPGQVIVDRRLPMAD